MKKETYVKLGALCMVALMTIPLSSMDAYARTNQVNTNVNSVAITMSTQSLEDVEETKPLTVTSVKVKKVTYSKEYKTKEGVLYKTVKYQKPVLSGDSTAIAKINAFYDKAEKTWIKNSKKNLKEAKEIVTQEDCNGCYGDEVSCKVVYNKNGYISIYQSGYEYNMGAHGSPYYMVHTFDLNSGKELTLKDILSGTNNQIKDRIIGYFSKMIKKQPEAYFEDALDTVKKNSGVKNKNFYLTKKGLVIFYTQYEIAAYAAGCPSIKIPYTTSKYFRITL